MAIYDSNITEFEKKFNSVQSDTESITHKLEEIKSKCLDIHELNNKWQQ